MLIFILACTPEPETEPTQNVPETSIALPENIADTVGPEMPVDAYRDLQTKEDTFDAMDEALSALG